MFSSQNVEKRKVFYPSPMTSYVKKRKEEIIQYMYYTCWVFSLLQYCDMTVYFRMEAYKKPSIAGGRIDTENDSALFIHDAADERITMGEDIRHRRQRFHREWGKIPRA